MLQSLIKFLEHGGLDTFTFKYYSADVEAGWTFDDEGIDDDPSLQVVYRRPGHGLTEDEDFWLYLTPDDAAAVGSLLVAWATKFEPPKD